MKYFAQFPTITTTDYKGNSINVTNIMLRAEIVPKLLNDVMLFYKYDIKDSDTPDIISFKYYNDSNKFWLVPFSNQTIDPQADWPMNSSLFTDYLMDKYTAEANTHFSLPVGTNASPAQILQYTQGTIKNYLKIMETTDSSTNESNTTTYIIDETAYNNTTLSNLSYPLPDGASVKVNVSVATQSIYEYEVEQNEAKRNINILDTRYAGKIESQLSALMRK